jgi:hypothetical protein
VAILGVITSRNASSFTDISARGTPLSAEERDNPGTVETFQAVAKFHSDHLPLFPRGCPFGSVGDLLQCQISGTVNAPTKCSPMRGTGRACVAGVESSSRRSSGKSAFSTCHCSSTPGTHHVGVRFRRTWDRTAGGVVSVFSAAMLIAFAWIRRRRPLGSCCLAVVLQTPFGARRRSGTCRSLPVVGMSPESRSTHVFVRVPRSRNERPKNPVPIDCPANPESKSAAGI